MACCANCKTVIFRLFLAIRMLRVFGRSPNPFRSCCEMHTKSVDCTDGLKILNAEVDELRVLFHDAKKPVPEWKPCEYCVLYCAVCVVRLVKDVVPVPEMKGLLTGML